jgi:S-layer like family, C-terminal region
LLSTEKTLVHLANGKVFGKKIVVFDNVEHIRVLSNPLAWQIMQLLSDTPMYPIEIAKKLRIYEQSAYYYVRKLVEIGALEEAGTNHVRGGTARLYHSSSPAFGIEMGWGQSQLNFQNHVNYEHRHARRFFNDYIVDNSFKGLIVVGAPDPHGPYRSSARDGHYAVQLAFFLGTISNIPSEFIVKLDADAKAERVIEGNNLISIGGPGTNIITAEFNKFLPIKFNEKNFWSGLVAGSSAKPYNLDNQGLIAKIKNPYNDSKNIIIVAGVRSIGTKSAVIALTNYSEEILKSYQNEEEWALVVQGFDMNADGKIDHVDIISEVTT